MNKTLLKKLIREEIKNLKKSLSEDESKKNRFLGIFGPGKNTFQRKIKKVSSSEIEKLIQYTESNGDEVERVGKNSWGITKESGKDNQAVWQYLDGSLLFENPNYPSIYDTYIRKELKSSDPEQAIRKMADALGVNVNISLGQGYNKIEFIQKRDVDEKTFEQMIQFLEKLGYNVDLGKSVREYDLDPGERHYYPQIRF